MSTDVLVVGAGPTGLLLAGDLARAGIDVTVLERRAPGISNLTRAFGVHARTLEELDARGMADALVATGSPIGALRLFGHAQVSLEHLPTRFPYVLMTPQYQTEKLLQAYAEKNGVQFEHDAAVTALTQDADGVTARCADGREFRARYLVGTDGVHSAVREALGLPFPGESVVASIMLADVRLAEPLPDGVLAVNATDAGFAMVVSFGDGWFRVMCWSRDGQRADDVPVDLDELRATVRAVHGTDFGLHDPRWLSRFHSDERQVPQYRVGRVFLAGDAAHVHSPAGGQGMNTGLQDAANLGWKLATAVHGRLPAARTEELLDSYQAERHPVGEQVLKSSGNLVRLAMASSAPRRAARAVLATVIGRIAPLRGKFSGAVSGVGIAYAAPAGSHPLAGKRAADYPLDDGRLYEALRTGAFVLIGATAPGVTCAAWAPGFEAPAPAVLVRPDGYIAAAGTPAEVLAALPAWTA
ncbi:FAD-dependent oxidoreductase [Hamadaea tsunoensis]|uniref:FAD-dependent oxidoreductase n=1 Tax=Hamadaea tsunoensis TaxID=53368 RepID=UPI000428346E|nr:FAD-dependent oxidoreductase [Hamadaea tsunoensis]